MHACGAALEEVNLAEVDPGVPVTEVHFKVTSSSLQPPLESYLCLGSSRLGPKLPARNRVLSSPQYCLLHKLPEIVKIIALRVEIRVFVWTTISAEILSHP